MSDYPSRIGFAHALELIQQVAAQHAMADETLALSRCQGRILREPLCASIALPGFDNSAMDGFAVRAADVVEGAALTLVDEQFAGLAKQITLAPGQCVRITTGAPVPAGADSVIIKEHADVDGSQVRFQLPPDKPLRIGQNIRRQGEDIEPGQSLLQAGQVLTPARIAVAAAQGIASLPVAQRPTVAVFTTGDELVEPGLPLQAGQIYNSNRELLMALLRDAGLEPTAWPNLPDDPDALAAMLRDAGDNFDVVLTCGAVSAGEKDHIPAVLAEYGRIHFWKVMMKPGMPVLFGELGRAVYLGLPGNPVSVLATWLALGRELTDAMQTRTQPRPRFSARLIQAWQKKHPRLELLRGQLQSDDDGVLWASPNPADGSHRIAAAASSDALIVLPEGECSFANGDVVQVMML